MHGVVQKEQNTHGRYFVHEHPSYASSWEEACVRNMLEEKGVELATCDQCMYGSSAADGSPVKKPTMFMTNAPELAGELGRRCTGRGEHAAGAAVAPILSAEERMTLWRPSTTSNDVEPY